MMAFNLYCFINELYVTFNLLIVLIYFILYTISKKYNYLISYKQMIGFSLILLGISSLLLINFNFNSQYLFFNLFKINDLLLNTKLYLNIMLFFILMNTFIYIKINKYNNFEQFILILAIQVGIYFILSSNNITILYLSLELISISIYLLISLNKINIYAIEIGLKYFILGAISSNIILFGFSLLYGITGLTNLNDYYIYLLDLNNSDIFLHFSFILIIIGFFFKLYIAPFHLWISDIYQGTATHITYYISIIPSISIYLTLIPFLELYNLYNSYILNIILISFSLFNILLGTLGALYQKKVKRLIAYSTITYNGYFLLCLIAFINYNSILGLYNFYLFYLFYLIILIPFFNLLLVFTKKINLFIHNNIDNISDFKQLYILNSLLTFIFVIIIFNFAGIPPFFNFMNKLILFFNLIKLNFNLSIIIFLIFITVISCFYYLRLIKIIYFNSTSKFFISNNNIMINNFITITFFFSILFYIVYYNAVNIIIYSIILNYIYGC